MAWNRWNWPWKSHIGRTQVNSVLVLSDPGLSHASVSPLFLCREKERDVWASCLLLGVPSDGFNHSWVLSSFPSLTLCILFIFLLDQHARQPIQATWHFFHPFRLFSVLPKQDVLCLSAIWMHFYFACV